MSERSNACCRRLTRRDAREKLFLMFCFDRGQNLGYKSRTVFIRLHHKKEIMIADKDNEHSDLDWENRILCSDESCIGVIGPDGRCKECGKMFDGDISALQFKEKEAERHSDSNEEETDLADEAAAALEATTPDGEDTASGDEWENRILCNDESCIGVIGPDGRCKECGKPFQP